MRQRPSVREHFRRGNAGLILIVALQGDARPSTHTRLETEIVKVAAVGLGGLHAFEQNYSDEFNGVDYSFLVQNLQIKSKYYNFYFFKTKAEKNFYHSAAMADQGFH